MNYTKYVLKDNDELGALLEGKDNLFVVSCNKCFKEFETVEELDEYMSKCKNMLESYGLKASIYSKKEYDEGEIRRRYINIPYRTVMHSLRRCAPLRIWRCIS